MNGVLREFVLVKFDELVILKSLRLSLVRVIFGDLNFSNLDFSSNIAVRLDTNDSNSFSSSCVSFNFCDCLSCCSGVVKKLLLI